VFCVPLQNGFIQLTATSSNNPVNYLWSNGSVASGIYALAPGTYSVTMTDAIGCPHDTSFTIVNESAFSMSAYPNDTTVDLGSYAGIRIIPNGDNISFMYWGPAEYIVCDTCSATSVAPIQTIYYTAYVTSDSGCTAIDSILVTVIPFYNIYVPNAFTPNGDGNNDYFSVFGEKEDWKQFSIKVFDRWGEKVYESEDENFQWDGRYKGHLIDPQVFVWEIHLTYLDNHTDKIYKGSVTLIR
jgi:gliding motility-associated-like protein